MGKKDNMPVGEEEKESGKLKVSRRDFLKGLGASTVAAAMITTPGPQAEAEADSSEGDSGDRDPDRDQRPKISTLSQDTLDPARRAEKGTRPDRDQEIMRPWELRSVHRHHGWHGHLCLYPPRG